MREHSGNMVEGDVHTHKETSKISCSDTGPERKVDGGVCDRAGHGSEGVCFSSQSRRGEELKAGNEDVHLNESSGCDPAVLAMEEEQEHVAGVYFFWVDKEDEEGSPVPRRGREGEVFTALNRIPREGAQVVFLKNDSGDSDEEESDHAAGVYFFSVDKEPGQDSGEPRRAREEEVFTAQNRDFKEGFPVAYRSTSLPKRVRIHSEFTEFISNSGEENGQNGHK